MTQTSRKFSFYIHRFGIWGAFHMHVTQIFMHQRSGKIKEEILLIQPPQGDEISKAEQHVYKSYPL